MSRGHAAVALLIALILAGPARAEVVDVAGTPVASLAGRQADRLTLARWQNGAFHVVPSQWVAWSKGRPPYFTKDDDARRTVPANVIAKQDHLLLRRQDAGPPAPAPLPADVVATLTLGPPASPDGYLYLFDRAPPAFAPAVSLERHPLAIHSADYRLDFRDDNLFRWGNFTWAGYHPPPGHGPSLLDTLKLRLSAGIFTAGARLTLTNANLDPTIRQVIQGPLATLLYVTTRVKVAHLPVLTVHNYLILERDAMRVDSRLTIPGIARLVLRDPSARVTVDGNNLQGAHLQTSWTGDLQATVDGRLSDTEKEMLKKPVGRNDWLWFGTGRGFALMARLDFVRGFDTRLGFVYQDDPKLDDPPERFPGQEPNVGFRLSGIPFGHQFYFKSMLYFSDHSHGLSPQAWARRQFTPPAVTVEMAPSRR